MKKVITYGSFDLFHEGHYKLLERAKALGDYLIVGVTTEQYDEYRGKLNVIEPLMERVEHVKQTGFADQIIIEDHVGQKVEDIQKYGVDIFTVGSDWLGKFEYLKEYCSVVYLERTKDISSTLIRNSKYGIIRLGVIGSGRIAKRFIPEVKYVSGVNVEAIYNPHIESANALAVANELNIHTDDISVLYEYSDAIYIASPHSTHYGYIKDALEHGKHVLCEKPLVLSKNEAIELFELAESKGLVLMEALKTAYIPGFSKLTSTVKSGSIGTICDVEACFTKLISNKNSREYQVSECGGCFTELASYPLFAIIKFLGRNYTDISFTSFCNEDGIDLYTKAIITYPKAIATVKVGMGVKSEGCLVVSGTSGYLYTHAPWWLTKNFELRFEDENMNEKFFAKCQGDALRYEIGAFISRINGHTKQNNLICNDDSILMAEIMEMYLKGKKEKTIKEILL